MNGLSLCAGVGGLDQGVELAFPDYRCVAAVENNPEAARRFRLRFPEAKVFEDAVGFDGRPWRGVIHCVAAGWPCQPHSVAGKRLGTADERWIWSDIARILDETGAPVFFGENVSGLLRDASGAVGEDPDGGDLDDGADEPMGGFGTVLRDLASLGFVPAWGRLRAAEVGASHGRPRVFVLAVKPGWEGVLLESAPGECGHADERDGALADPSNGQLPEPRRGPEGRDGPGSAGEVLADANGEGRSQLRLGSLLDGERPAPGNDADGRDQEMAGVCLADSECTGREVGRGQRGEQLRQDPQPIPAGVPAGSRFLEDSSRPSVPTGGWRPGRRRGVREAGLLLEQAEFGLFAPGPSDPLWVDILAARPDLAPALSPVTAALAIAISQGRFDLQAEAEPDVHGLVDGLADLTARWLVGRRPRLQCGGNGVVPLQAAVCYVALARRLAGILGERG